MQQRLASGVVGADFETLQDLTDDLLDDWRMFKSISSSFFRRTQIKRRLVLV